MNETVGETAKEDISAPDSAGLFGPDEPFGTDYHKLLLEQYRLYVDTSTKVSERRAAVQTFFLTANTLLATVYGVAAGKGSAPAIPQVDTAWQWLVPLAGLLLALSWFVLIGAYSALNSAKFKVIHELERRLPARMFDREWQIVQAKEKGRHTLTQVERLIPLIFAFFFAALMLRALAVI
jgi:hypothetical protein